MKTTLDIDADLLADARKAADEIGKPLAALIEDSLKLFLKSGKVVIQDSAPDYRGGSLDRNDPFFLILAEIEEERHNQLPREPVRLD